MKKVLLAMSGGVDSSVSALILKQQGYEVLGVTMKLTQSENEINAAKVLCEKLEIKHYILDLQNEFKQNVINDFIDKYKQGVTPNPCIVCNKKIKFGILYDFAMKMQCDFLATGHYAKVEYDTDLKQYVIKKSNALSKDQTYVLYGIDKNIIEHIIFPLGEFENKEQIRKIAEENGLEVANKKDSQDICFIPNNDYSSFIGETKTGNIVDIHGNILGKHSGYMNYTIGQRKGLGISNPVPLYVIEIRPKTNEIVVGEEKELYSCEAYAKDLNFLLPFESEVKAKIRYSAKEALAKIELINDKARIVFYEPQRAITPGQSIVFYKDDILFGGGIIDWWKKEEN